MTMVEVRGCGEEGKGANGGDGGKTGSGLQRVIISDILASQRLLELCVRNIMTAPLRGPLGE